MKFCSNQKEWDNYFMGIAYRVGMNSKCLSRKIGAVLVKDKSIISTGYNGPPREIPHCENRNENRVLICPRRLTDCQSGECLDMCPAGHAERNAIVNAARMGVCTKGAILYCDCGIPCKDCLVEIINAGIIEIVYNTKKEEAAKTAAYRNSAWYWIVENMKIKIRGYYYEP